MWWVIIRLAKLLAWFRFQESVRKIIGQMHGCVEKDFLIAVLGEEICNDNVVDSSHDRSSTRSNFFKFSYQSANIVKTNHGMSHVIHLDETTFKNSGLLNRYSSNYWVDETSTLAEIGWSSTPMIVKCMVRHSERSLNEFKLFNGTLTEVRYNTFLTNKLQNPLENVPYATRIWF